MKIYGYFSYKMLHPGAKIKQPDPNFTAITFELY